MGAAAAPGPAGGPCQCRGQCGPGQPGPDSGPGPEEAAWGHGATDRRDSHVTVCSRGTEAQAEHSSTPSYRV
jgi:hypothetical protein